MNMFVCISGPYLVSYGGMDYVSTFIKEIPSRCLRRGLCLSGSQSAAFLRTSNTSTASECILPLGPQEGSEANIKRFVRFTRIFIVFLSKTFVVKCQIADFFPVTQRFHGDFCCYLHVCGENCNLGVI